MKSFSVGLVLCLAVLVSACGGDSSGTASLSERQTGHATAEPAERARQAAEQARERRAEAREQAREEVAEVYNDWVDLVLDKDYAAACEGFTPQARMELKQLGSCEELVAFGMAMASKQDLDALSTEADSDDVTMRSATKAVVRDFSPGDDEGPTVMHRVAGKWYLAE